MSDNISFEIQIEIIRKLPVKSLIQFRSVSKPWKSLIDSSKFIADYHHHQQQQQNLLIRYVDRFQYEPKYISIVDDNSFPQHKCYHTLPTSVSQLRESTVIAYSHGLLCLFGYIGNVSDNMAVIWNLSIRKAVAIPVPQTDIAFGVCRKTSDPKIVKIKNQGKIEIFTLSSGVWRRLFSNLPRMRVRFTAPESVVIDGVIYWLGCERIDLNIRMMIISFDLTSEEFSEVDLPDKLAAFKSDSFLSLYKLKESLVVLKWFMRNDKQFYEVWMMDDDRVSKLFTQLYNINKPVDLVKLLGFRKKGELIMSTVDKYQESGEVLVYEPSSEQLNHLGIHGDSDKFSMSSYRESLLLLDQKQMLVDENDGHIASSGYIQRFWKN